MGKKVIVELKGGLGNQMFQYATARGICRRKSNVFLDTNFFKVNNKSSEIFTARNYELKIFKNLRAKIIDDLMLSVLHKHYLHYKILRRLLFHSLKKISQKDNEYIPALENVSSSVYLDGYFQSEKYFKHIKRELLDEFKFPHLDEKNTSILNHIDLSSNSVSIHVRRGDFLKSHNANIHGVLPLSYYKHAVEKIVKTNDDVQFFIFSNDIEWCRLNFDFLGENFIFIIGNDAENAWKDMYLMTKCKHHIVANSSFSWWGAWLSEHNGLKIAPYKWFNPEVVKFDINDFVPSNWEIAYYD